MRRYFDTSFLVAAFVADEPNHEACAKIVGETSDAYVLAHGLAETFSILTGGRLRARVGADAAATLIGRNVVDRMNVVELSATETMATLESAERLGIRGGGIYDALHLAAARKVEAEEIYTLNVRHFRAFAPDLDSIISKG